MSLLNRLERRLEPFAIRNLTLYIVIGQTFVYLSAMLGLLDVRRLLFVPTLAIHGEAWRFLSFIFIPPDQGWLFIAFALYLFYLFGSALEHYWGELRYNLFLLTGYLLTVGLSFLNPDVVTSNTYIGFGIFLAFAFLNPDFELYILFILPVKMKWAGLLTWLYLGWSFLTGYGPERLAIAAGVANFFIFFARDLWLGAKLGRRRMQTQARRIAQAPEERTPRHTCHVCGKTDLTDPTLDFRYCSKCAGDQCYCPEHLRAHEHVLIDPHAKP